MDPPREWWSGTGPAWIHTVLAAGRAPSQMHREPFVAAPPNRGQTTDGPKSVGLPLDERRMNCCYGKVACTGLTWELGSGVAPMKSSPREFARGRERKELDMSSLEELAFRVIARRESFLHTAAALAAAS